MRQIDHIVIHCTATPQHTSVASIERYWKSIGWKRVGYHKIITSDGFVHTLAEDSMVTNGVAGHNARSIHISYIGGVDARNRPIDNRTDAQKEAMAEVVNAYQERYPQARVLGHRDFAGVKKACPSFDVRAWLKTI